MNHQKISQLSAQEMMIYLKDVVISEIRLDINKYLFYIDVAKGNMLTAITHHDTNSIISWAKIADFLYEHLITTYPHRYQSFLLSRINLRLQVIQAVGHKESDEITSIESIIGWLKQEFERYNIDEVEKSLHQIRQDFTSLDNEMMLSLRHLRYWVVSLNNLKEIDGKTISQDLQQWLDLKGKLP